MLKTKLRGACEKYSKITVPYKYKKVMDNLSKNKKGNGRGLVILNIEKCMALLDTERFKKHYSGSYYSHTKKDTESFEKKV